MFKLINFHSQAGYAEVLPEQEQQRFNAGIELKQQTEELQADLKNKNTLRSALVQIVFSIETLKDAVTAFGIKETLVILSSADDVCGLNNPLLLLATIKNDIDDFLTNSEAIDNGSKTRSFKETVQHQSPIRTSQAETSHKTLKCS